MKKLVIKQGIDLLNNLLEYMLKCIIACSVLFTFISVFVYNIQIQEFNSQGHIIRTQSIVQVDTFHANIKSYFLDR